MRSFSSGLLAAAFAVLTLNPFADDADSPREQLLLDFGWKFHLGDDWGHGRLDKAGQSYGAARMNLTIQAWRTLNLPHDWAVELPFDANANFDHGYKPLGLGFPTTASAGIAALHLPEADAGKRLWLEFDGVFRDSPGFSQRLPSGASRKRLQQFPLRHHGRRRIAAATMFSRCAWTLRNLKAGFTKAREFTATSGWKKPRQWRLRRMGFLFIANSKTTRRRATRKSTSKLELQNKAESFRECDGQISNYLALEKRPAVRTWLNQLPSGLVGLICRHRNVIRPRDRSMV